MDCLCCGICNCPCTNVVVTLSGCTLLNGEYTLTPDTMYGAQCLYTLSTTVSGFTLSLKFNCRTNQFVFDWNGEHFADEVTIESADPFEASISGSIDCDGDTVTLFADLTCDGTNPVDCMCCGFDGSETITATLSTTEINCALDGQVITMTSDASSPLTWIGQITDLDLSGYNWIIYLRCNGDGTWTSGFGCDNMDGDAFQDVPITCYPFEGTQVWYDIAHTQTTCESDCIGVEPLSITFTSESGTPSCLECCGYDLADHPANLTVTIIDSDCPGWIGLSNTIPFSTAMLWTGDIDTGCADPGDPSTITLNIRCAEGSVLWEWFEVDNNDVVQAEMVSCDPFTLRFTKTLLYAPCDCTWVQVEVTL